MPGEALWVAVVVLDKAADGFFEFFGGAMDAAAQLFAAVRLGWIRR
jgi:hypothetical protein